MICLCFCCLSCFRPAAAALAIFSGLRFILHYSSAFPFPSPLRRTVAAAWKISSWPFLSWSLARQRLPAPSHAPLHDPFARALSLSLSSSRARPETLETPLSACWSARSLQNRPTIRFPSPLHTSLQPPPLFSDLASSLPPLLPRSFLPASCTSSSLTVSPPPLQILVFPYRIFALLRPMRTLISMSVSMFVSLPSPCLAWSFLICTIRLALATADPHLQAQLTTLTPV